MAAGVCASPKAASRSAASSPRAVDGKAKAKPKAKQKAQGSSSASSKPTGSGDKSSSASGPSKSFSIANKAFDESEQVNLKCNQFLNNLQDPNMLAATAMTSYDALLTSIEKRLTKEFVSMYTTNYSPTGETLLGNAASDSRGVHIFSDLRQNQHKLHALKGFISTLQAGVGSDDASAQKLLQEHNRVQLAGIRTSDFVLQMITCRAMRCAGDTQSALALLDPQSGCEHGVNQLDEEAASNIQKRLVVDRILDIAKVEGAEKKNWKQEPQSEMCEKVRGAVQQLKEFVSQVPMDRDGRKFILDPKLRSELQALQKYLRATVAKHEDELSCAERARDEVMGNKAGLFYKALTVFRTGLAVRMGVDAVLERAQADRGHSLTLEALVQKATRHHAQRLPRRVQHWTGVTALITRFETRAHQHHYVDCIVR